MIAQADWHIFFHWKATNLLYHIPTASITPVKTAGLSEWMRIFFSSRTMVSKLMVFSTPRFLSMVEKDDPLQIVPNT